MRRILPVIVLSQFLCTSLWFAGNAVIPDILTTFHLPQDFLGNITAMVQFGFITGTLAFALFTISDRYSPSKNFFICAIIGGVLNLGMIIEKINPTQLLVFRFVTGFFLAGIYPVGMKIAADHYKEGLGKSLGFLVGALVIGTAFPHLLKSLTLSLPWKYVIIITSMLAFSGGLCMFLFVEDGPYRKPGQPLRLFAFFTLFRNHNLRAAAFGYFGHMWELYTFWAFVPVMLATYQKRFTGVYFNIPLLSFFIIGSGSLACMGSGLLSQRFSPKKIAGIALAVSGSCCLLSPFFLFQNSVTILFFFLLIWGLAVIADSPMFSTLVAQSAPAEARGSVLTIVNCIGFAITIISIQLVNTLLIHANPQYLYLLLAAGPVMGLLALFSKKERIAE